jgi:type II secretory pathway component GspD/PulD (secretin)
VDLAAGNGSGGVTKWSKSVWRFRRTRWNNQPLPSPWRAAASTVIGLTTGLFGTAQISALITMAESRGEAKTVATPRVTALNNRPAQIESGSQIPVQTTQAASGTAVVTTTFVSVPLRLSITPQITDVGTVILRVTIENNTINTGIAVGGVPGIDTQRMQTEVLVPDGGTTVMGGVLADTEGETQQRTPGLASIPVLGNLFKRKLTTRQNSEILFFITPHIYRPDYQGRPTSGRGQHWTGQRRFRSRFRWAIRRATRRRRRSCSSNSSNRLINPAAPLRLCGRDSSLQGNFT